MTEEREDELRQILLIKQRNAAQATASVLQFVESIKESLDPSEVFLMTYGLAQHYRNSEVDTEKAANAYEIEKYGVELGNIDGEWDAPIILVDRRRKPEW